MSKRDSARTPPGVWWAPLRLVGEPAYDLDAATDDLGGVTVPAATGLTESGLDVSWGRPRDLVWCNPPFSRAGGGKLAWAKKAIIEADHGVMVAFYCPVYGDRYADLLEAAAMGTIRIGGGRVRHVAPPGITYSTPMQTAHRIWLLGRGWPSVRLVWDWKEERWI